MAVTMSPARLASILTQAFGSVTGRDVTWADVICVMEEKQGAYLRVHWPAQAEKSASSGSRTCTSPLTRRLHERLAEVVRALQAETSDPGPTAPHEHALQAETSDPGPSALHEHAFRAETSDLGPSALYEHTLQAERPHEHHCAFCDATWRHGSRCTRPPSAYCPWCTLRPQRNTALDGEPRKPFPPVPQVSRALTTRRVLRRPDGERSPRVPRVRCGRADPVRARPHARIRRRGRRGASRGDASRPVVAILGSCAAIRGWCPGATPGADRRCRAVGLWGRSRRRDRTGGHCRLGSIVLRSGPRASSPSRPVTGWRARRARPTLGQARIPGPCSRAFLRGVVPTMGRLARRFRRAGRIRRVRRDFLWPRRGDPLNRSLRSSRSERRPCPGSPR